MKLYDGKWMHMKAYECIWENMMVLWKYMIVYECKY